MILQMIASNRDITQLFIQGLLLPMSDPKVHEAVEARKVLLYHKKPEASLLRLEHPTTVAHQHLRILSQVNRYWRRAIKAWRMIYTPAIVKIERGMTTRMSKRTFSKKRNNVNVEAFISARLGLIDAILDQFVMSTVMEDVRKDLSWSIVDRKHQIAEFPIDTKIGGKKISLIPTFRKCNIETFSRQMNSAADHLIGITYKKTVMACRIKWKVDEINQMLLFTIEIKQLNELC